MTMTVQIARPKTRLDQLIEQLQQSIGFFAARPQPAGEEPEEEPREHAAESPDRLPPTSELPDRRSIPGDPVDTSQHDPKQAPADQVGARPASRENRSNPDERRG
ncbi:hypothetical protein [Saccharopolyspora halophila]